MSKNLDITEISQRVSKEFGIISKPNIFYLSLAQHSPNPNDSTTFNQIIIGPTNVLQSSLSSLFRDYELKHFIGKNSSNVTVYNYNKSVPNNLYNSSVSTIYRLPRGSIGISHSPKLQNFGNFFGLPSNDIEIAPITFGTGDFLNKTGAVVIVTGETTTKTILVYISP